MWIEIGTPASLPLGVVRFDGERGARVCLMGVTLQHPPVQLFARPHSSLSVTGARADKGHEQAQRFLGHHGLQSGAEIEIELAIPESMGLGSEAMLGLTVARALAWAHDLPLDDAPAAARAVGLAPGEALQAWGFHQGGFLLVETQAGADGLPGVVDRHVIEHPEKDGWAFVFLLPRRGPQVSPTLEADRLAQLLAAAPRVSAETGRLFDEALRPAIENDDFDAFAGALMAIQQLNYQALEEAGTPYELTDGERGLLDLMRDGGARAWGRSLTGLALYGLIRGATPSVELRQKLLDRVGIYGGWVMATVTDNDGSRHDVWDDHPISG